MFARGGGTLPRARSAHALAGDGERFLLVFGGADPKRPSQSVDVTRDKKPNMTVTRMLHQRA